MLTERGASKAATGGKTTTKMSGVGATKEAVLGKNCPALRTVRVQWQAAAQTLVSSKLASCK